MGLPAWFTSFSRVLPTSRVVYYAGKPMESVVYCLSNPIDLLCIKGNGYSSGILSQDFQWRDESKENQHPIYICLYLIY